MWRVSLLGREEEQENETLFPSLSLRQRMAGWAACYSLGIILTFLSFGSLAQLILGRPKRFAILYSVGNITSLASTMFLVGPRKQWAKMWEKQRAVSTLIYVMSLISTLFLCIERPHKRLLILISVLVQSFALLWYCLSFVPFGHTAARRVLTSTLL